MDLAIEFEQEEDGRWIAEITNLSGVLAYGQNRKDAAVRVKALALRTLADQIEHGERSSGLDHIAFLAA
jgi:predicted RNase H-like HicB family nuclease